MPAAPWLNPPNFIGAMQGGAGLGAQLRGQDIAAAEAANRLRYSYDAMAAQQAEAMARLSAGEREAAARLQASQEDAAARLADRRAEFLYQQTRDKEADRFRSAAQALDEKAFTFRQEQEKAKQAERQSAESELFKTVPIEGLPGQFGVRTGPGSGRIVNTAQTTAKVPVATVVSVLRQKQEDLLSPTRIAVQVKNMPKDKWSPETVGAVTAAEQLQRQIDQIVLGGGAPAGAAPPAAQQPVRVQEIKTGRTGTWTGPGPVPPGYRVIEGR